MQRLVTRLTLAMLGLAVMTAIVIAASVPLGSFIYVQSLPPEVREGLESQVRSPTEGAYRDAFLGFRVTQTYSLIVGALVSTLVTVGFARYLAGVLSKPFEEVSAAAQQVAQGNLNVRVSVPARLESLEVTTLTQTFNAMAQSLETFERERRDMIAAIAHDLRTPLSAVQVRLELLKENVIPYSEAEVDLLLSQTELLSRLINDLRTLSLADAGKLSLQLERLELSALIKSVLSTYEPLTQPKNIRLSFATPADEVFVTADAGRLTQVLSNLLDNALRVTPAGGMVRLALAQTGDTVTVSVSDAGPGISEDLQAHIFERFVQGKDKTGSSGLGLAIVKTLSELQGGTVSARNVAGGGAVFEVEFPI